MDNIRLSMAKYKKSSLLSRSINNNSCVRLALIFRFSEFEKRKSIWLSGTHVFLYSLGVPFSSSAPLTLLGCCCFPWLYLASWNLSRQRGTCGTSGFMYEIHPCSCVHLEHEGALNPLAHDYLMQQESYTYSMSVRCRWNAVCLFWGQWFLNQVYYSRDIQVLDEPKQFHLLMTVKNAASLHLLVYKIPNQTQLIMAFWMQITSVVMIFYKIFFYRDIFTARICMLKNHKRHAQVEWMLET